MVRTRHPGKSSPQGSLTNTGCCRRGLRFHSKFPGDLAPFFCLGHTVSVGKDPRRPFILLFNVFTIFLWGWFVLEFFSRRAVVASATIGNLYLLILGYYAAEKEIRRWQHRLRSVKHRGEFFVLGWTLTGLTMLVVEVFGGAEHGYRVPQQLPLVVGSVLVVFLVSAYLKSESRRR